jgi:hypothetical protein
MSGIVNRASKALFCVTCGEQLPSNSASDDWCSESCYRGWAQDVIGATLADHDATEPPESEVKPATQAEVEAAARLSWRDALTAAGLLLAEFLRPWRK